MAGNPSHIDEVLRFCQDRGLPLIEDICEAFGSKEDGVHAGNSGLAAAASTHGAHHICTGEGGLVFTDDEDAYAKMRRIRDWGRAYGTHEIPGYYPGYVFSELGLNLHASDIQAALGIVQLDRVDGFTARRKENFATLHSLLDGLPVQVPDVGEGCEPSWFAFPMLVPEGSRDALIPYLENAGVECRTVVAGNMGRQPICDDNPEDLSGRGQVVPAGPVGQRPPENQQGGRRRTSRRRSGGSGHDPAVSVLLTSYNRPQYLPQAVESVLAQTMRDWELIILDDSSSDPGVTAYLRAHLASPAGHHLQVRHRRGSAGRDLPVRRPGQHRPETRGRPAHHLPVRRRLVRPGPPRGHVRDAGPSPAPRGGVRPAGSHRRGRERHMAACLRARPGRRLLPG